MRNNILKTLIVLLILTVSSLVYGQSSLSTELQAEKAQQGLKNKGISDDEVKARLLDKGIDLDNLKPEQLPTLEDEIKKVVTEIEAEKDAQSGTAISESTTTIERGIDSLLAKQAKEEVGDNAAEVIEDIEDGASLEEALANDLTDRLSKKYRVKTDIFGQHIFFDKSIDLYRTTSSSTTPNSYVLDVGDKIAINIFGASQADLLYEIEEDGFIRPTGMYKVYLKGITIEKAKILLRNRFRQGFTFSDGQFNVDLHTARTINVNLFGEVNQPGSYTISALNTAINAIIAAGGITSQAGIRNIRIISKGQEKVLDIYDFVANPRVMYDYYLQDNDIIYISKWQKLVRANGKGFKTEGRFEMLENEGVDDLLTYTQGLNSRAFTNVVRYTTSDGEKQVFKNYTLDQLRDSVKSFKDGDIVTIGTSTIAYENYVAINGAVRHPGKYELTDNMRVCDVLTLAYIEEETFSELAYLTRKNTDGTYKLIRLYIDEILANPSSTRNVELKKEDVISIYGKSSFVDTYRFSVQGAVRAPNSYFYDPDDNITIYDAIMMSKGLMANATNFGYVIGSPTDNNLEKTYAIINLNEIMSNPDSDANLRLKAQDTIVIPATEQYQEQFKVSISGAVNNPGEFVYDSTLSVKQMLIMAGGLKLEAATNKVDVFRLKIANNEPTKTYVTTLVLNRDLEPFDQSSRLILQPYDHIVVRNSPEFEVIRYVNINGEVRYPGLYAILDNNETVSSLVKRAGGVTSEASPEASTLTRSQGNVGLIVTRVDKAINGNNKFDLVIKQGDVIEIPKKVNVVKIDRFGTNSNKIITSETRQVTDTSNVLKLTVNYSRRRADWFINQFAGGFDRQVANRRRTLVLHPNGQTKKTLSLGIVTIYPKVRRGSEVILVPRKKYLRSLDKKEIGGSSKEKLTLTERLATLQSLVTIVTSTATTSITSILLIKELNK
ncbi:SLBB domain-containing protein [Bacteroidia bacterium]|nr:SLBB domain-containing protein [Bacteroidia bacterium]